MNRYEPDIASAGEARLRYGNGAYQVIRPGDFVRCAVTGRPVQVGRLNYWSVALQEPYASAAESMIRAVELRQRKS